ncbi:DUF2178 domain-containing protein [Botrimarina mediterranea]|uniref:DUF2178 domain-containing protein n=1 Tax=Botrimarina mediterranea TaxID=2528022 RepID=UPI001189BB8F|nr:hypothetical protein K2D_04530 [Planctomycetes bacterium K2D]
MTATEKSAWTELIVVAIATIGVGCLLPWLGNRATGMFGFLGFLPLSMLWLRRRGGEVVVDERDQRIQQVASHLGMSAAWMVTFLVLIGFVFWSSQFNEGVVPTIWLTWLVWIQFAVCYGAHAIVYIVAYRRLSIAS